MRNEEPSFFSITGSCVPMSRKENHNSVIIITYFRKSKISLKYSLSCRFLVFEIYYLILIKIEFINEHVFYS